jgi:hypothetical protein
MVKSFKKWVIEWKIEFWKNKWKILLAALLLILATILYNLAGTYTSTKAPVLGVPDIILGNIASFNWPILIFVYIWVFTATITFIYVYPIIFKPKRIPYILSMIGLWLIIRAGFIILTHLKTPADAVNIPFPWMLRDLYFQNDMFFSGHTGAPFLAFLMFRRDNKIISYAMLALSIIFGITVLLLHQHYSIDVAAAFFITYGIYKIGNKLFNGQEKS